MCIINDILIRYKLQSQKYRSEITITGSLYYEQKYFYGNTNTGDV